MENSKIQKFKDSRRALLPVKASFSTLRAFDPSVQNGHVFFYFADNEVSVMQGFGKSVKRKHTREIF
jgi:hypothetical protein